MARTASKSARRLIVDSSAILAIVFQEPGWELLLEAIENADYVAAPAPNLLEAGMVFLSRRGRAEHFHDFIRSVGIEALPFADDHFQAALKAFDRYGKGRHPASLNFGDCMAYAAANVTSLPLLFVGDDFTKTDLTPAFQ